MARDLDRDVRRGAEAVEAEPAAGADVGAAQRAVADDAGAEQRRGLRVGDRVGQRVGEVLAHDGVLGVAAVGVRSR